MSNRKVMIIYLIVGLIKQIQLHVIYFFVLILVSGKVVSSHNEANTFLYQKS